MQTDHQHRLEGVLKLLMFAVLLLGFSRSSPDCIFILIPGSLPPGFSGVLYIARCHNGEITGLATDLTRLLEDLLFTTDLESLRADENMSLENRVAGHGWVPLFTML